MTKKRPPCKRCNGEGWFVTRTAGTVPCPDCGGKGHK